MARFRATIKGQRGPASRLGSPTSGLRVTANGWDSGVYVETRTSGDIDVFEIYATGGSNGGRGYVLIATVTDGRVELHGHK